MKRRALSLTGALAGIALLIAGVSDRVQLVEAADHGDGIDAMSTMSSDITDLYSWVWDDNGTPSMALILNVDGPSFPDNVQYAFTLVRDPLPGETATVAQVICQFNDTTGTDISCFYGDPTDFVIAEGDPSATAGFEQNGMTIFAGERSDPFFFNLDGFSETAAGVQGVADDLETNLNVTIDENGCPDLLDDNSNQVGDFDTAGLAIQSCLTTSCDNGFGATPADPTAVNGLQANVLSLVVSIPVAMLPADADSDVIAVSASTHVAP